MTELLNELEENEKVTIINGLTFLSQGMGVDRADEFNHLAGIVKKIQASMKPKENDNG